MLELVLLVRRIFLVSLLHIIEIVLLHHEVFLVVLVALFTNVVVIRCIHFFILIVVCLSCCVGTIGHLELIGCAVVVSLVVVVVLNWILDGLKIIVMIVVIIIILSLVLISLIHLGYSSPLLTLVIKTRL